MNFLAHIYLSGDHDHIKIGNFIGDYVKGKKYLEYPVNIQKGILLHRGIDDYTDKSEIPREVATYLKPYYRRYAGILVDLFYDHFLAKNWSVFSDTNLEHFINQFYRLLQANYDILPKRVQNFLPHMIYHNRLLSYSRIEGIRHALEIMTRNTSLPDETTEALRVLENYYDIFNDNFMEFFPQLIDHIRKQYFIDLQYSFNSQL
jgi:acyl carrier protein phosphodiesterase